ncbi:unnamed protein product [Schistosoma turkestanicum]|nr:unnamed protein product [Schistosoma turkestanicum]
MFSPSPTRYYIKRFTVERPYTCSFKSTGRTKPYPLFSNNGLWLLPGAYNINQVDEKLHQCHRTYSFKNTPRKSNDILFGIQDKTLCLAPGQYNPYNKNDQKKSTRLPEYHSMFKTKYPRTVVSPKKENVPPPGAYNLTRKQTFGIISPFVSQVPRFKRTKSFAPGPGTYEISGGMQPVEQLRKMGTHCGLFFRDYENHGVDDDNHDDADVSRNKRKYKKS